MKTINLSKIFCDEYVHVILRVQDETILRLNIRQSIELMFKQNSFNEQQKTQSRTQNL